LTKKKDHPVITPVKQNDPNQKISKTIIIRERKRASGN